LKKVVEINSYTPNKGGDEVGGFFRRRFEEIGFETVVFESLRILYRRFVAR
jgi:acetylornithine deacetylase/succinyl-diaminopimelate desuccinylase-like protein